MSKAQHSYFEETAVSYSSLFSGKKTGAAVSFETRVEIAKELASGRTGRLLDCAVGSGEVTEAVMRSGNFSSALLNDFSPSMLELAKRRLGNLGIKDITWSEGDCFDFLRAVEPGSCDFLMCLGLIAHTGRLDELLGLLRRDVSAQGAVLFQSTLAEHWGVKFHRLMTAENYARRHGYAISYQTSGQVKQAARNAGFKIAEFRKYCLFIPGLDRLAPALSHWLERATRGIGRSIGSEGMFLLLPE